MLDTAGDLVRVTHLQSVLDPVDRELQLALERQPELLVRMAVREGPLPRRRTREVQHRAVAEERLASHTGGELEPAASKRFSTCAHQPATTGFVRSPIRSTATVTVSPGLQVDRRVAEAADAGGRARGDDVAGLERDQVADERDQACRA